MKRNRQKLENKLFKITPDRDFKLKLIKNVRNYFCSNNNILSKFTVPVGTSTMIPTGAERIRTIDKRSN